MLPSGCSRIEDFELVDGLGCGAITMAIHRPE